MEAHSHFGVKKFYNKRTFSVLFKKFAFGAVFLFTIFPEKLQARDSARKGKTHNAKPPAGNFPAGGCIILLYHYLMISCIVGNPLKRRIQTFMMHFLSGDLRQHPRQAVCKNRARQISTVPANRFICFSDRLRLKAQQSAVFATGQTPFRRTPAPIITPRSACGWRQTPLP